MKKYPSIGTKVNTEVDVIGFDKLDGSNIRAFWKQSEKGFVEFGTRTLKLNKDHKYLGASIDLITTKYEQALTEIFLAKKYKEVTCFFEFFGQQSFAGRHELEDHKEAVLIDLMIYKKGLVHPVEFVEEYEHLGIPPVLFSGRLDEKTIELIKQGELPGMTEEGVVFKGRGGKKGNYPIVFKIKSKHWVARLKELCGDDEDLFKKML